MRTKIFYSIQSWWPNTVDYFEKYTPNQNTQQQLFQDLLQFTKIIQLTLGKGFEFQGKKYQFKTIDLHQKHLDEKTILHKDKNIYNTNIIQNSIDTILEETTEFKPTTDSHPLNFLINPKYEEIYNERKNLFMKIDNELSSLSPDCEHINLLFFQPQIVSEEVRTKLLKPYMENPKLQFALLHHRLLSNLRSNLKMEHPNYKYLLTFLDSCYQFIHSNKQNLRSSTYGQNLLDQINSLAQNLPKIHQHLYLQS